MTEEPAPVVILVVEDDPFVRELLVDVLLVEGYTFISTAHGAEALTNHYAGLAQARDARSQPPRP